MRKGKSTHVTGAGRRQKTRTEKGNEEEKRTRSFSKEVSLDRRLEQEKKNCRNAKRFLPDEKTGKVYEKSLSRGTLGGRETREGKQREQTHFRRGTHGIAVSEQKKIGWSKDKNWVIISVKKATQRSKHESELLLIKGILYKTKGEGCRPVTKGRGKDEART